MHFHPSIGKWDRAPKGGCLFGKPSHNGRHLLPSSFVVSSFLLGNVLQILRVGGSIPPLAIVPDYQRLTALQIQFPQQIP